MAPIDTGEKGLDVGPWYVWYVQCPGCGDHQRTTRRPDKDKHCDRCPDKGAVYNKLGGPYDVAERWEALAAYDAERTAQLQDELASSESNRDFWRREHWEIKHRGRAGDQRKAWENYTMFRDSAKELRTLLGR